MKYDPLNYNNRKPTSIWVYQAITEWTIYLEKKKELLANLYTHIIKEAKDDYSDVKWLLEMM